MTAAFTDALAAELWAARRDARAIGPVGPVDAERGRRVATELYAALRAGGAAQVGWKLAFTDEATQARFGTDRPFSAPVFASSILTGPTLRRSALVAPMLEAEIAVFAEGAIRRCAACIEIADCRFAGWRIKLGEALADFGLQGFMRFGTPSDSTADVHVVVRLDGTVVAEASRPVHTAFDQLQWLDGRVGEDATIVATGSMIRPIPLAPGRWELDFGHLGRLDLDVTA